MLMKHRKQEHYNKVSVCRNDKDNWCTFSSEKCWYRHEEQINDEQNIETPEMIQRIFNMMETFKERIEMLENQI